MPTLGWLFLIIGGLLLRQVAYGRTKDIPTDARDALNAIVNPSSDVKLNDVAARRGTPSVAPDVTGTIVDTSGATNTGGSVLREVMRLGSAAKGYRLGSTGPDYYDCSSIVWRACYNLGITKAPRWTTSTFPLAAKAGGWAVEVTTPSIGDVVDWYTGGTAGGHMGICNGADSMYAAKSTDSGIGTQTISGVSKYLGTQPHFWRFLDTQSGTTSGTYSQN